MDLFHFIYTDISYLFSELAVALQYKQHMVAKFSVFMDFHFASFILKERGNIHLVL